MLESRETYKLKIINALAEDKVLKADNLSEEEKEQVFVDTFNYLTKVLRNID